MLSPLPVRPPHHSDSCYLCPHSMDKEKGYPWSLGTLPALSLLSGGLWAV